MITKSRAYSFNLFGYSILIWKKQLINKNNKGFGGVVNGSCKITKHNDFIALSMPDGTLIPHQIELTVESNVNECATATVKMFVDMDKPIQS